MLPGLTSIEAKQRLESEGYNELPSSRPKNIWRIALEVFKEPMFLLLITCGALYILLGDYREGIILLCTIFIIIFITFYQYRKTERALEALKKLASPRTLVIRDGKEVRIPGREVVPGDVMVINEGDRVSADANLTDGLQLTLDESLLTGESLPVIKSIQKGSDDNASKVFSGTLVVKGRGLATVMATGAKTQFGKIGTSIIGIVQDETRLQKEMKVLIRSLFLLSVVISIGIVLLFYYTRGNFIQSLLNGLAASMAILPEEFPVVLTVFMALGAWRLSKKNVLTRKPSAIESLGSATVLCSDKTGTITMNKMEVAAWYKAHKTYHRNEVKENIKEITPLIMAAHQASLRNSSDPMEKAIQSAFEEWIPNKEVQENLIKEYPLGQDFFAMTRVVEGSEEKKMVVSSKGAPEIIFTMCRLDEAETAKLHKAVRAMAEQGYRVLAVAGTHTERNNLPEHQKDFHLSFIGLVAFEDPIRPEAKQAIRECNEAGIKVIMMTGDYPETARNIARQAGLPHGKMITGDELKRLSNEQFQKKILVTNIFARVVPDQKLRIVEALKANHEVVAMTGDGVNDAPALKAAHIGIAMGNKGTDVAREASSLVLLDDNFASIVSAIRSGRRIFDNLQKAMSYIISIHIPIIGLTLLPAFFTSLPLLLLPLHIVFMELIIDPVCSVAFESEQEEKNIMKRKPRNPEERFFGGRKIIFSIIQGLLLLGMVMAVYLISLKEGHTDGEVRAIAFSSLILGNIFLILTNLSRTRGFISIILERNIAAAFILTGAVVMLLLIIIVPQLQQIFSIEFPGYRHFIPALIGSGGILVLLEVIKYFRNRDTYFTR